MTRMKHPAGEALELTQGEVEEAVRQFIPTVHQDLRDRQVTTLDVVWPAEFPADALPVVIVRAPAAEAVRQFARAKPEEPKPEEPAEAAGDGAPRPGP